MAVSKSGSRNILITGALGFLGSAVMRAALKQSSWNIIALDIKPGLPDQFKHKKIRYEKANVYDPEIKSILKKNRVDTVVHLASIVNPGKKEGRGLAYRVDVEGTENLLKASVQEKVKQFIVTSSGAAYGYHADNSLPLREDDPIRGNYEFAYSYHKRLVEEMLLRYRKTNPALKQLIFRPGTILGKGVANQITRLFENRVVLAFTGSDSPFVFIQDTDVSGAIIKGIKERSSGIYNLAGDGALTLPEIARILNKPLLRIPASLVQAGLWLLKQAGLAPYGPEQVRFLQYRPVLDNTALKAQFGYIPEYTSRQVFDLYRASRIQ